MARYQCPFCLALHNSEDNPACSRHGVNSSRSCTECQTVAHLAPCVRVE